MENLFAKKKVEEREGVGRMSICGLFHDAVSSSDSKKRQILG
jgi:hypothetical protein